MRPTRLYLDDNTMINKPKGTPIWRLLMDPYIIVCAGALAMVKKAICFVFEFNFIIRQMLVWLFLNQQYRYGCVKK
jgi:hypothetical protein